jgi:hypothetical protein
MVRKCSKTNRVLLEYLSDFQNSPGVLNSHQMYIEQGVGVYEGLHDLEHHE